MRKHQILSDAIHSRFPEMGRNPDKLAVFVENGRLAARIGADEVAGPVPAMRGFEYRYELVVLALDFDGARQNELFWCVLDWIREWQPELLLNPRTIAENFTFQVDVLDTGLADVSIRLALNEAIIRNADGAFVYNSEPKLANSFDGVENNPVLNAILGNGSALVPDPAADPAQD